jgi:serine/threonine protein kinase
VSEIGEGAFAHVFRARERATGREVALKVLKEIFRTDGEIVERFRREVFAVSAIDSPHVVRLYDFGTSGDEIFIAMEFVQGPTLREVIADRTWSAEAAHVVVGQIAQAVAAAHRQGIVHRDLKPENVMLVGSGERRVVKVLDFGLAKLADMERRLGLEPLTRAGMCFGTPQYMAPEQMQGKPASESADLWALSVIAYELMSGRLPWDGADPRAVFQSVASTAVPPLGTLHASVTRRQELDQFFVQALAKDPKERPADASALFRAFELALKGRATDPRTVFSTIVSTEFAIPEARPLDDTGPQPAIDLSDTLQESEFAPATMPSAPHARMSSKRRLHSQWNMSLTDLPPLTDRGDLEAPPLAPPPRGPRPSSPSMSVSGSNGNIKSEAAPAAATLYPSLARESAPDAGQPSPRSRVTLLFVVVGLILMALAAGAGYWLGRGP